MDACVEPQTEESVGCRCRPTSHRSPRPWRGTRPVEGQEGSKVSMDCAQVELPTEQHQHIFQGSEARGAVRKRVALLLMGCIQPAPPEDATELLLRAHASPWHACG